MICILLTKILVRSILTSMQGEIYSWIPHQTAYYPSTVNMVRSFTAFYNGPRVVALHDLGARINIVC
jgi:hypothetical protein